MSGLWVFGYGSLVSHESFSATLGRSLRPGVDHIPAELRGFGRRWNYGVMHTAARWIGADGAEHDRVVVALGLVASAGEIVNGVVGRVNDDELAALDHRERHYDRVDVTSLVSTAVPLDEPVATYVPRPEAIARYEAARDDGSAAIEQRYWDLVDAAFADLGPEHHDRYVATTPVPDIPVLALIR